MPGSRRSVALVAAAMVALAACAGGDEQDAVPGTPASDPGESTVAPTLDPADATSPTDVPAGSSTAPPRRGTTTAEGGHRDDERKTTPTTEPQIPRMPLTGAVLGYAQLPPDRPALVVKIDNNPVARPQSGLNGADIVFEEIIEVGTRFAAVYHSAGANPVGPIRSGRTQDVDLLTGLDHPLFAWSGGNPGVTAAIDGSELVSINGTGGGGGFFRAGDDAAPHNLYNTTDAIWAQTTPEAGRPEPMFYYLRPGESPRGEQVSRAEVRMDSDRVLWEWSPEVDAFLRVTNGVSQVDANTGERISATNVVVLGTGYRPSPVDARSPEAITIGGGPANVFIGGRWISGHWLRDGNDQAFALFDNANREIRLAPGRTWVELADAATYTVQAS